MSKYYKCEYCGRRILTEVCRYCGGINEFNEMSPAPPKAEKSAPQKKESTEKTSKKRFPRIRLGAAELIIGSVLILVGFLVFILWDAEIVWDKKENKSAGRVLEYNGPVTLTYTHNDITDTVTLPFRLDEINETHKFINPVIVAPDVNDPNGDGIYDIIHNDYCITSDSYGIFGFYVSNHSDESIPYLDGICEKVCSGDHFRNCSSLIINGTELIADIDTIIDSLGEPSKSQYSSITSTYTYNTTNGYISLKYDEERDPNRPNYVEISQNSLS